MNFDVNLSVSVSALVLVSQPEMSVSINALALVYLTVNLALVEGHSGGVALYHFQKKLLLIFGHAF